MQATLSVVGTPIGNLDDITVRALTVLRDCDVVLCEDTRVTRNMLHHFDIKKPLVSYHEHSGHAKYAKVATFIEKGMHLALVSDAGTPAISDPGARLISWVRAQYDTSVVRIEAIPGPSAVTAALSISGAPADTFTFFGFPPHKKGRQTFFSEVARCNRTVVFYESPHRILKALQALATYVSPDSVVVVCRELTKMFEEVVQGHAEEVHNHFIDHPETVRGEFVVVVYRENR